MEAQARALEDEVRQVCELEQSKQTALQKQRLYSRVGQFLMGSLDMRHWWCGYPSLMVFMMRVLELYPGSESVCVFYDRMAQQLGQCRKCVDIYHASLPSVLVELEYEYTAESIKAFFFKIAQLDAERIQRELATTATGLASDSRVTAATTSLALYEVLSERRLLSDFRIVRVLSKVDALCFASAMMSLWVSSPFANAQDSTDLEPIRGCAGLYQLLVSPDPGVRAWAKSTVQHFGNIQLAGDAGEDRSFFEVLEEWMLVLETHSFNVPVLSLDLKATADLPNFLEPTNCVKTPTIQILWSALDTVMQQMDLNSLEAMLELFDNFPDLVFNYLNDADPATTNQQITLVVCKCFAVMLRCLGHRFWRHTVNSPKVVLDMVIQHCKLPSWRVFVTKQLVDLLPPLLASMRPPQISSKSSNQDKLEFYFQTRDELLRFLICEDRRPAHFEAILAVALSRAAFSILEDCYEHRLPSSASKARSKAPSRDDGALSESISIDYSVSDSAFWWPCGSGANNGTNADLEEMWMDHLFNVVVMPKNVESLVDHAAKTSAVILSKHLQLARDVVFTCLATPDSEATGSIEAITKSKPIVTRLLTKLCSWKDAVTIPLSVHGALFESIGGISELLNGIATQLENNQELQRFTAILREYEAQLLRYLTQMCDEVFLHDLTNPFYFPVVSQHLSACYLSPTSDVDLKVKRLIGYYAADKSSPTQIPSPLEAFMISVHRHTEAFLRGQLSMLQSWRLRGFSLVVCLPSVKKLIFVWSRVFALVGGQLGKALKKASTADTVASTKYQVTDTGVAAVHLLKLPSLINDFLIALLTDIYDPEKKTGIEVGEATRVQCLDFGLAFWNFWTSVLNDPIASSKRVAALLPPLVNCIARGSSAENKRAAELLMAVLNGLLEGKIRLDEATLSMVDSIKGEAASIESRQSTDFGRVTKKFRQLDKTSQFFTKRSSESAGYSNKSSLLDVRSRPYPKPSAPTRALTERYTASGRPMSGKSAARAQARMTVDLTGVEEVSNEAATRKQHSFYSEVEYHAPTKREPSPAERASKSKTSFDMAQVIKSIAHSHPGSNQTVRVERSRPEAGENSAVKDEEDAGLQFAALFHRIKTTRKPVPACSLLPFYRQLLQVCMPVLLSREFQREKSDKVLEAPELTFKKSADYVRAFLPLLLEECNNEVQEGLRRCSSGGSGGHLLRYESEKPREGMRCLSFSIAQKDEALLASSQSKFGRRGRPGGNFNEKLFRNGDVVLLRIASGNQKQSDFMGKREFVGVILISEMEKGRRQTTFSKKGGKDEDEESVKVLFLNDGELESVTGDVRSFSMEMLTASAIADSEWKVSSLCNLVTSTREYIGLRSVDMLPEHLRTTILTPNTYKSTQSELILMTTVLDELRGVKSGESHKKVIKLLKRLDKMDVMLTDLRSTSIGKAVNKLRKHDNGDIKVRAEQLKEKWTSLMDKNDALQCAPRFLPSELWDAIKPQYNSSQLQSIHSVLNNYSMGVSLLQGPPGTGKTKTIMGLLSGLLSLRPPATAVMPVVTTANSSSDTRNSGDFNNFQGARFRGVTASSSSEQGSSRSGSSFSLSGVTSALGSILRRSSDSSVDGAAHPKRTTIQSLKNATSVRSRLESKLASRTTHPPVSSLVVKRRVVASGASVRAMDRTNNILLCAPSNGAVNELVLRIVTDGLMDSTGTVMKVRAPSVHPEALSQEWLSIVRLGNAGEDAPDSVNSVCLPHIIRREMAIHPKAIQLRALQDTQRQLRSGIHDFHNKPKDPDAPPANRKALAMMHRQLTECSGKIRRLRDEVFALRAKMTEAILSKASIIACTLSKAGGGDFSELKRGFDALIIDEAAQAVELSTLVPIRERVARVVLVGDPKQLPATVKSVVAANARYDRSLFERIAESGVAPSMLRVQYRMHPFLREFPSKRFYGGMLTDGPSVMERVQKVCPAVYAHTSFQPFLLYDIENSREEDMNGSKYNRTEAAFCVSLCQTMFETCADVRNNKWNVGFVSPYKEQVRVLRQEITRSGIPSNVSVEVNTVDGFQGREKDVIVFSCVRASRRGGIGFLRDIRRLNVAITRARFCLYVVGNVNTLVRDETWAALVKSARDRRLVIPTRGEAFPAVAKRLASDDSCSLAEHFKAMHEKTARKSVSASSTSAKSVESKTTEPKAEGGSRDDLPPDGKPKRDPIQDRVKAEALGAQDADNSTTVLQVSKDSKEEPPSESLKVEPLKEAFSVDQSRSSRDQRAANKRPAVEVLDNSASKIVRRTEAPSSVPDRRDRSEGRSFRGPSSSSTGESSRRDEHDRPREGARDESRGSWGYGQSRSGDRDDRRSGSASSYRPRYGRDDQSDRSRRSVAEARGATRSSPVASESLRSISEKEFCQMSEPPPPAKVDQARSKTPRVAAKRPFQESKYPPPLSGSSKYHAATQPDRHRNRDQASRRGGVRASSSSGNSSNRTVSIVSNPKSSNGSGRGGVLRNILGSASKLATATSRVNDKAGARSSQYS